MPRLTPQEKREVLVRKRAELDAQIRAEEAKHKAQERKRDTRRKVIAGAIALEQMERNPEGPFAAQLRELLGKFVEPRSRELFPFLPALAAKAAEENAENGHGGQAA
jgi:hypothetical protein